MGRQLQTTDAFELVVKICRTRLLILAKPLAEINRSNLNRLNRGDVPPKNS